MNAMALAMAAGQGDKNSIKQLKKLTNQQNQKQKAATTVASAPIPLTEVINAR